MDLKPGDILITKSGKINSKIAKTGEDALIEDNGIHMELKVNQNNRLILCFGWWPFLKNEIYVGNDGKIEFYTLSELNNSSCYNWSLKERDSK